MGEITTLTDLPEASQDSLKFIQSISQDMISMLVGRDDLLFMSNTTEDNAPIGTYSFSIVSTIGASGPILKVNQNVSFTDNKIKRMNFLLSDITHSMRLLELHLEIHIYAKYHLAKEVNIMYDEEKSTISFEYTIDDRPQTLTTNEIMKAKMAEFMAPGQRFILLKLFVMHGSVPANMRFCELDESNEFVTSVYTDLGKWTVKYEGNWTEVMGIERKLFSQNNVEVARYFFDDGGTLLLRIKPGSDLYVIHPSVNNTEAIKHFFIDEQKLKMKFEWDKDIEMKSIRDYIQERMGGELEKYIYKHPEWKRLIADFLQQILLDKPDNVIDFAITYFTNTPTT